MSFRPPGGVFGADVPPWLKNMLGGLSASAEGKNGLHVQSATGAKWRIVALYKDATKDHHLVVQLYKPKDGLDYWTTMLSISSDGLLRIDGTGLFLDQDFADLGLEPQ